MTDIPEHEELIDAITDALLHLPVAGKDLRFAAMQVAAVVRPRLAAAEQRGAERERERWLPAAVYYERYCQDEADDPENCVCGERQHEDAKAFAAAVRRGET